MTTWEITTTSDKSLIDLCYKAQKDRGLIGGRVGGTQVIKVSDQIAVNIVHVPKVYRHVVSNTDDRIGYLFMEYIPGQNLEKMSTSKQTRTLHRE
ncbi:hypothetical protein NUU61_003735 [Penicillium alfredii]|uniref:Aminoglycoside phosphotransferase domain-containing protein n=1 Tax=Penicillium alfredii TaxID=1506179 RepID=A0A9W9FJS4_9EURO|nr:uncharacterized protein NUU61_003735 [Penicillium alfredii]KAJ5101513.1 hypothetical protein NUU61_003735 [Penicillium alfredii]